MGIEEIIEAFKGQGLGDEEIKAQLVELQNAIGEYLNQEPEKEVNDENIKEVFGI